MPVIDITIEPHGRTRVLFDCGKSKPLADDEALIAQAIVRSQAAATEEQMRVSRSGGLGAQHQPAGHLAVLQPH